MNDLGWLYGSGRGVSLDYGKAREWYQKAAAGNTTAMKNLGCAVRERPGRGPGLRQSPRVVSKQPPLHQHHDQPAILQVCPPNYSFRHRCAFRLRLMCWKAARRLARSLLASKSKHGCANSSAKAAPLDPGLPGQLAEPGALFFVVHPFDVLHCLLRKASLNLHFISLDDSKLALVKRQRLALGRA